MKWIVLFSCVLSVLISRVYSQGLIIEFFRQTANNLTSPVNEVVVDSTSIDRLQIVCKINGISNIVKFNNIILNRVTSTGSQVPLVTMQTDVSTRPGYQTPYLYPGSGITGIQAVGSFSETDPTIGISIPFSSLSCSNADSYNCTMSYGYAAGPLDPLLPGRAEGTKNLTVSVQPNNVDLRAFNQSSSLPIQSPTGTVATNMAHFMIGQVVKLTCKANLGTRSNGLISWKKSNIVAGSDMANYIPNNNEREEGQVVANGCQFEKTDSIMYNMTDQDAIRTSNNPLQFQCYISIPGSSALLPETTMKNFFIKVYNVNEPTTGGLATAGSGDAGVIAGAVIGSLVGIVIIVLLVYFLWYRRRAAGDDYTTKEEQGASNPNLAPEPQYAQSTKKRKSEDEGDNRPKPLPRKGPKPGTELHYAELDLNEGPHKAPRRKGRGDTVEYAEVEFKEISI
ncbi:uncharacterized protein LOC127835199 isoform X3 [Dreissena polymorpha]|uniref:uncharacterized protein LOC127835199 isoform X3 n=1 Tax=Dreissena polymorpha TaxID=45954 RepID=UPI0022642908|nr:uncharacterized protein LOC127835199 isoform X3 [Dreissena polymorpha]